MLSYNDTIRTIRLIPEMRMISDPKIRRYIALVGIFLIMGAFVTGVPGSCGVSGNDPDSSQNLEIRTWYDLNAVRDNMRGNHTLMNDLNSTTPGYDELASPSAHGGKGWQPIGYSVSGTSCGGAYTLTYGLSGILDGQGYQIRDLFICRPDEFAVGLIAYLKEGGIVRNVGASNVSVVGHNVVGSLLGYNAGGTVENCYSIGDIAGSAAIGGLVGRLYSGSISNCYSTGSVTGESSTGGLVGQQHSESTVSNSYSACSVVGGSYLSSHTGGLVGDNFYLQNVINCFWDTETSGQTTSAGGTGKNTTEMQNISTFSGAGWNIIAVALNETNPAYSWNIVNNVTYPFLGWQL